MPTSGDIVLVDLGVPQGHEAGFPRPAVVVTAQDVMVEQPTTVQVVPITSTLRDYHAEVRLSAGETTGLSQDSAAQCQHVRSISASRVGEVVGRVSPPQLRQVRETLGLLLDIP